MGRYRLYRLYIYAVVIGESHQHEHSSYRYTIGLCTVISLCNVLPKINQEQNLIKNSPSDKKIKAYNTTYRSIHIIRMNHCYVPPKPPNTYRHIHVHIYKPICYNCLDIRTLCYMSVPCVIPECYVKTQVRIIVFCYSSFCMYMCAIYASFVCCI